MGVQRDIDTLLEEVVTLPSLPTTVASISEMLNDPHCNLADVGRAISADPAIALKTLRLVNSAFCGLRQQVNSVEHAVAMLGLKVIKNLVFTAMVFDSLQSNVKGLMRHSIACGFAMRVVAETEAGVLLGVSPQEAFVFGLLHDVGKIVFEQYMPEEFGQVGAATARQIPWFQAEREVIGTDHAEMGARLAENWKLAPHLVGAIAGHHDLSRCANDDVRNAAAVVAIADYLCTVGGFPAHESAPVNPDPAAWEAVGLSPDGMESLIEEFRTHLPAIEELIELAA